MKIEREELSFGKAFTAAWTVLYSPDVLVPARTIIAPDGGDVLEAAKTVTTKVSKTKGFVNMMGVFCLLQLLFALFKEFARAKNRMFSVSYVAHDLYSWPLSGPLCIELAERNRSWSSDHVLARRKNREENG